MGHRTSLQDVTTPLRTVRTASVEPEVEILFSNVPKDVGDGFSDMRVSKDSTANASITRSGPDAKLLCDAVEGESAQIRSKRRINYNPGELALAGWQLKVLETPSEGQDIRAGASNGDNGVGVGVKYFQRGDGTPGATKNGAQAYAFRLSGGTETIVPQEHWNLDTVNGSGSDGGNPSGHDIDLFRDGNVVRIDPAIYYGDVEYRLNIIAKEGNRTVFTPVHSFVVSDEPMTEQPNVPLKVRVENNSGDGTVSASSRAMHAHGDTEPANTRSTGDHRRDQTVTGTLTPLVSFRIRDGWDHINVTPEGATISTDNDLVIEVMAGSDLTGPDFDVPDRNDPSDTSIATDTSATGFDDAGDRRYITHIEGGFGFQQILRGVKFDFTLDESEVASIAARAPGGNATVSTSARVQEDF